MCYNENCQLYVFEVIYRKPWFLLHYYQTRRAYKSNSEQFIPIWGLVWTVALKLNPEECKAIEVRQTSPFLTETSKKTKQKTTDCKYMLQIPVTSDMQTHSLLNRILLVKWSQIFPLLTGKYITEARGFVLILITLLLKHETIFHRSDFHLTAQWTLHLSYIVRFFKKKKGYGLG